MLYNLLLAASIALCALAAGVIYLRARNRLSVKGNASTRQPTVVFLHPDLGIGGAERLIIDAAMGLLRHQSVISPPPQVILVTTYHDPNRAFPETTDGSVRVVVYGNAFPRTIFNRGHVLCATVRMWIAAVRSCIAYPEAACFVVDQVAAALPVLALVSPGSRRLFYCHFPDMLCDPSRGSANERSMLHRVYRAVFDRVEERTMQCAQCLMFNSQFTRSITLTTFPRLKSCSSNAKMAEDVLYPPVDLSIADKDVSNARANNSQCDSTNISPKALSDLLSRTSCFVSINRFERKKGIDLAIEAFCRIRKDSSIDGIRPPLHLVIAGGFDHRLEENVREFDRLRSLALSKGLRPDEDITFLRSFSNDHKLILLKCSTGILYTPIGEHFGIVPIEGMACGAMVVATATGGPLESVGQGDICGFLREPTPEAFAEAMLKILRLTSAQRSSIGNAARARCAALFSMRVFSSNLAKHINPM